MCSTNCVLSVGLIILNCIITVSLADSLPVDSRVESQKVETLLSVHKIKWRVLTVLKYCDLIKYFMRNYNSFQTSLMLCNRTQLHKVSEITLQLPNNVENMWTSTKFCMAETNNLPPSKNKQTQTNKTNPKPKQ